MKFELTAHERRSELWSRLEAHMRERLDQLRQKNDSHQPENTTADTRGRIGQIKELLALGLEPKVLS